MAVEGLNDEDAVHMSKMLFIWCTWVWTGFVSAHMLMILVNIFCCAGLIGKITLHIPLRRLRSEPWVISIEKLYLVAGPLSNLQVILLGCCRKCAISVSHSAHLHRQVHG